MLDEDELAEIKRAKQRERERIKAKNDDKIESFEMIKPVMKGGEPSMAKGPAAKSAAAKKKKGAKT